MNPEDIVVTGIGVYTSIGQNRKEFWEALTSGVSGAGRIRAFDPAGQKCQVASEVKNFDPLKYVTGKRAGRMGRFSQLAVCAAFQAIADAGIQLDKENTDRIGCVIGTAAGDYEDIESQHKVFLEKGPGFCKPFAVPKIISNMSSANIAIDLGIHGPNIGVATACSSGSHAIGVAMGVLKLGQADIMLAGGAESTITPLVVDAYACMGVLTSRNDDPETASRPFDAGRDGFVIGEGSGVLVLERYERARRRGAEPLAVLSGFGMTSDAYSIAIPEPEGVWATRAMEHAIQGSGVDRSDVGYINAHGTSTKVNDRIETIAIKLCFGSGAYQIPISSTKSMIGHTLGAAGGIEAAATVLSIYYGVLPPTINYQTSDPDCDLDIIPNEAREVKVKAAVSNSFGFGGQNSVLLFSKA